MSRQFNLTSGLRAPRLLTPLSNMAVINNNNRQATFYQGDFQDFDEEAMIRQFSGHNYTGPSTVEEIFHLKPSRTMPVPQESHLHNAEISRLAQHRLSEPVKIVSPIPLRGTAKCLSPDFFEADDHYTFNSPNFTPQLHVADPFDSWYGSFSVQKPAVDFEVASQSPGDSGVTSIAATVKGNTPFNLLTTHSPDHGNFDPPESAAATVKINTHVARPVEDRVFDKEAFDRQEKPRRRFKTWQDAFGIEPKRNVALNGPVDITPAFYENGGDPDDLESELEATRDVRLGSGLEALAKILMNNKPITLLDVSSITKSPMPNGSPATTPSRGSVETPELSISNNLKKSVKPKKPFKPNNMLLRERGVIPKVDNTGANTKYQGNLNSKSFLRTKFNLPPHENCSLFVSGVPSTTTLAQLFNIIRVGPVWALSFLDSDPKFRFKAFKLVFFNPESSAAFMQLARGQGIFVNGHRLSVIYNREGQTKREETETRVLVIEGPAEKMTYEFWTAQFGACSKYQLESSRMLESDEKMKSKDRKRMEFRFARVDGQAQTCRIKIKEDPKLKRIFKVEYGVDPCATTST